MNKLWTILTSIFLLSVFLNNMPYTFAKSNYSQFNTQAESLVKSAWDKFYRPNMSKGTSYFWTYKISPPFPLCFPPNGSGKICYYAYAYSIKDASGNFCVDSELKAAPWAKVIIDTTGNTISTLQLLNKQVKKIGQQGMGPVNFSKLKRYNQAELDGIFEQLCKITSSTNVQNDNEEIGNLKEFYCLWTTRFESLVSDEIKPDQREFLLWLNCKNN
jgi:hypothetical protein